MFADNAGARRPGPKIPTPTNPQCGGTKGVHALVPVSYPLIKNRPGHCRSWTADSLSVKTFRPEPPHDSDQNGADTPRGVCSAQTCCTAQPIGAAQSARIRPYRSAAAWAWAAM